MSEILLHRTTSKKVAALFVMPKGCYSEIPMVDLWDETRDARLYKGPFPVVAHPPCGTWGAFARQGWTKREIGDDDGCFKSALISVRTYGGVLEHPAYSSAWSSFGIRKPRIGEGWIKTRCGGWTCYVEQGNYGHDCRKPTWLYAFGVRPYENDIDHERSYTIGNYNNLGKNARMRTPVKFRDLLLKIATAQEHK